MPKERILVTVKTYPTLSQKYGETVCTAGVREDGSWVRIYPVPFRRLDDKEKYKKYDWVECSLTRNTADPRPETFRAVDQADLVAVAHMDTSQQWQERRRVLIKSGKVYTRLDEIIAEAKGNRISLATFKPTRLLGFKHENESREWEPDKLKKMRDLTNQADLFSDNSWRETFKVIPKLPFSFSYRFEDAVGKTSELQILDWEIGALYWNCLKRANGDEAVALQKVRQKYYDAHLKTDLHFFLGTTQQFHFIAPNPWVIIGVLPIPHETQLPLF
jgi:hypothetical protein